MRGVNWNSRTKTHTPIVRDATKARARRAQDLADRGWSLDQIAREVGRSVPRVREYLKPSPPVR